MTTITDTQEFEPIVRLFPNVTVEEKFSGTFHSFSLWGAATQGQILVLEKSMDEVTRVSFDSFDSVVGVAYIPDTVRQYKLEGGQPVNFQFPKNVSKMSEMRNFGMDKVAVVREGIVNLRAGGAIAESRLLVCSGNGTVVMDNGISYANPACIVGTSLESATPGTDVQVQLHIGRNL